ncbi:PH domain-containing protein [Maribacter polysiphoniae]|uniref:PH (Pleckstrin Homology) domain-containing protein n=1 Tax=Maribacter polysiphoniae TaxID=429344 RepID=A0A316DY84_9FLAO|nr:PH domain-containing protein [Maribacter polysiphoniae]MBD1261549.1 PH domain-containing protein [Maribacter polysiphoniae]PWK22885.1 PH (Pleckstrin Homology) domain-containing protein [Maribacter polysiphoniae]
MKIYKSKIGIGLVLFIVFVFGISSYTLVIEKSWGGLSFMALTAAFIAYLFHQTYYTIDGNILKVKSGFLLNQSYEISRITKISETHNPISAPAASLDRLEISFDNGTSVIISPKEKYGFIDGLVQRNPKINVQLRAKNKG